MVGLALSDIPLPYVGMVSLKARGGILSILWIIFFMNGLASGVSIIASVFCAIIAFYFKKNLYFTLALLCVFRP